MSVRSEAGVVQRLRRHQARFEPLVTRILLAGIFVTGLTAQFVRPVGDALEDKAYLGGALFSLVAFVLYDSVKELTGFVRLPARTLVNSGQLDDYVSRAFHARDVEIDFLGYTGETLYNEVFHRLEDLMENSGATRHVRVRVLVPDFDQPMPVPSRVGENGEPVDDPAFRALRQDQCRGYGLTLSRLAARLSRAGRVRVECEYRVYGGFPLNKVCIFNRKEVLTGLYDVSVRRTQSSSDALYYDPKGFRTDLAVSSPAGGAAAEETVATWNRTFDSLWRLARTPSWVGGDPV